MLAQVLVAAGIGATVAITMASTIRMQQREIRALNESLARTVLATELTNQISSAVRCSENLQNNNYQGKSAKVEGNPTNEAPLSFSLKKIFDIKSGVIASSHSESVLISPEQDAVRLLVTGPSSGGSAPGKFAVKLDQDRLVRPLRDIELPVRLSVNSSGNVTGCRSGDDEGLCYGCYRATSTQSYPGGHIANRNPNQGCSGNLYVPVTAPEGSNTPMTSCVNTGKETGGGEGGGFSWCKQTAIVALYACRDGKFKRISSSTDQLTMVQ